MSFSMHSVSHFTLRFTICCDFTTDYPRAYSAIGWYPFLWLKKWNPASGSKWLPLSDIASSASFSSLFSLLHGWPWCEWPLPAAPATMERAVPPTLLLHYELWFQVSVRPSKPSLLSFSISFCHSNRKITNASHLRNHLPGMVWRPSACGPIVGLMKCARSYIG